MNQRIGNVGLLNLLDATEESIKGIERIENVGMVLYREGNAGLLSALNIGNIGSTSEVPEGYSLFNGILKLDDAYLKSISEPVHLLVNGEVIVDKNVHPDDLKKGLLHLMVNGKVYSPAHLSGLLSPIISKGAFELESYQGTPPRMESGKFTLTNSFLQAIDEQAFLVISGVLSFSKDLNMEKFDEKISKLEVHGKIFLYEEQEAFLYKKTASLAGCKIEVIPAGYEVLNRTLRLNNRSIRRFKQKKLYTKKPILFDVDVTRELITETIAKVHSTSVIVCHEQVEDLMYELTSLLDTEILSYEHSFIMIEGEEVWSNEQFLALDDPTNFIVNGKLILNKDVSEDVLRNKVVAIDNLGEVTVHDKKLIGVLQNIIRVNTGSVEEEKSKENGAALHNVGKLSL
ncbi:hypothetical protein BAVI_23038 [Neobacillus vireti LMG 21834]|uniref:Uncharacterized protein n=2 Tax=Neobacillus TaxID=2675232 RepID=A0AB94IGW6_9BACI|nr:hypothetical protein BAVI_23038 [Neobacillus vireti LMG 21834]KLT18839.1 hypothetical protein AA980_07295 [Neobacillus vireti]